MATYGTIPTPYHPATNLLYVSRTKERLRASLGISRPWKLMLNIRSFSFPGTLRDAASRARANLAYFRVNYAVTVLAILFLSLLWHPISLIVFIVMMATWLFLYFLRDEPLEILGHTIDDRITQGLLAMLTVAFLLLTGVTWNVVGSLIIGAAVVLVHGVVRRSDDLLLDEESDGLMAPGS